MKKIKITINPYSHAMLRLIERLNVMVSPKETVECLNEKFSNGIYEPKRTRVYVPSLGYFGLDKRIKHKSGYFATTFYRGLCPTPFRGTNSLRETNVYISWFLDEE